MWDLWRATGAVRELWRLVPDRWKLIIHVLWPAFIGGTLSCFILPAYWLGGRWWTIGITAVALALDLTSLWRLRPLLP